MLRVAVFDGDLTNEASVIKFDRSVYNTYQPCYLPLKCAAFDNSLGQSVADVDALLSYFETIPSESITEMIDTDRFNDNETSWELEVFPDRNYTSENKPLLLEYNHGYLDAGMLLDAALYVPCDKRKDWIEKLGMPLQHAVAVGLLDADTAYHKFVECSRRSKYFDIDELNEQWPTLTGYDVPFFKIYDYAAQSGWNAQDSADAVAKKILSEEEYLARLESKQRCEFTSLDIHQNLSLKVESNVEQFSNSLIQKYIYIESLNKYYRVEDGALLTPEALNRAHKHEYPGGRKSQIATNSFDLDPNKRTAVGLGWNPVCADIFELDGVKYANTYQPIKIHPVEGSVEPLLMLAEHICGEYACYVLDHMAFSIQYPEKKCTWHPLIIGPHRTGKSLLARPLKNLLGRSCVVVDTTILNSGWGDIFSGTKFMVVEEVYLPGNGLGFFNQIKARLANDDIESLNMKGAGIVRQRNLVNFYLTTNHDDAMRFDEREDKLLVIEGPSDKISCNHIEPEQWYSRYVAWSDSIEGLQAVFYFLKNRDLSNFTPGSLPVRTDALRKMCLESRPDYQHAILEWAKSSSGPFANEWFSFETLRMQLILDGYRQFGNSGIKEVLTYLGYVSVRGQESTGARRATKTVWTHKDSSLAKLSQSDRFAVLSPRNIGTK